MNKINEKSSKYSVESDLNFYNLVETTYCLLKAYVIWIYINFLRVTKIERFINFVKIFIFNVKARIYNNYSQRRNLLIWIKTKIKDPISVTNFREDWKDGIALCALMEAIVPGICPRFDLLNRENAIENLNLGLFLAKKHLNIDSPIESQEIHDCKEEAKLVYLLSKIKLESIKLFMKSLLKRSIVEVKDSLGNNHKMFESLFGDEKACFAKGMGLILGVRTRKSRFNIFCKPTPKLNLMIEISGPNNTMCSKKIGVFNPKKRVSADVVTTSVIADYISRKKTSEDILKIPFFYEVFANRIVVTYIPLMKGIHKLSIIWQGQHILNSPYTVKVEDCSLDQQDTAQTINLTSPNKFIPGLQWPVRKDSFSLEDSATVVGRKVLKQTIIINGRQQQVLDERKSANPFDINLINEELHTENDLENNDFKTSKHYNEYLASKKPSVSQKLDKLLINGFNRNTNLFDIKECDSLCSEKMSSNDTQEQLNFQCIDQLDNRHKISENKTNTLSHNLMKHNASDKTNKTIEETIASNKQQIVSNQFNYKDRNVVNNINYRSYIPVKNMIQNWEMKLTNNINEVNEKKYIDKNLTKTKIPCILINNRREVFENNISTPHKSDSNDSNSTINSSLKDEDQISSKVIANETERNETNAEDCEQSEDINQNYICEDETISKTYAIESESDLKSPESQPDSGICTHIFPDLNTHIFKKKLSRRRSISYPDIRSGDNMYSNVNRDEDNHNTELNGTRTSSISGQYIDDEIPDYSNLFLGDYVSYTGLLNADVPLNFDEIDFSNLLNTENDLNSNKVHDLGIYPEKCEVFGAGVYYGQVGVKNHFVVSTKDGGKSYLAVGVQSTESDDVREVSFNSIGQNRYEVQYEVSRPGYYVIFVKWGDYNIADSPFICKVTF